MKFLLALLPLLGAARCWSDCLTDADAESIAARSTIFLQHLNVQEANETAQGLFAEDIQEFGDSINSLRGDPVHYPLPTWLMLTLQAWHAGREWPGKVYHGDTGHAPYSEDRDARHHPRLL